VNGGSSKKKVPLYDKVQAEGDNFTVNHIGNCKNVLLSDNAAPPNAAVMMGKLRLLMMSRATEKRNRDLLDVATRKVRLCEG
jgi:hypothetical protein